MDLLKALIVATLLCLCFVRAMCDAASASPSPEQEQEIQMLRSKAASLEDEISRRKEETSELESVVRERTAQMATLKLNLGDDESVMKANTHNAMLEKQIERLGNDLEDQIRKGESLEARAIEAERSLHEFGRKLEHAEKTNIEQKKKIQDLSDRLQYAEGKLSILENEAKSKAEELAKAHDMWLLPHWLAVRVLGCQKLVPVARGHVDAPIRNATAAFTSAVANSTTAAYRACRGVIQACTVKVQNGVRRFLEGNRLLAPLSADELAWMTASALLALCVYKIVSAIVRRGRKDRLQRRQGRRSRSRRKQERRAADR